MPSSQPPNGARALERFGSRSLWAQLADDLTRRIEANEFTDEFPGELALQDEYGVSRHTVREALRRLRDDGTVTAARGRRPMLGQERAIDQPIGVLYSLFASVEAMGLEQRSVIRALDVRQDAGAARRLGLTPRATLVYLDRVRLAGDEPLALDRVWLPYRLARNLLDADFSHTALYDELASRCGLRLTDGQERISSIVADPGQRRLLHLPGPLALLEIERIGRAGTRIVEWRQTLIRGDRFSLSAHFSARGGLQLAAGDASVVTRNGQS